MLAPTVDAPDAWQLLDEYSFEPVRAQLLDDGTEPEAVERSIEELRRYFKLIALGYRNLGMTSPEVDAAWHAFILHTRQYEVFCQEVFGRFVHHRPLLSTEVGAAAEAAANLRAAYSEVFGQLDPLWVGESKCDGGGGKCQSCNAD